MGRSSQALSTKTIVLYFQSMVGLGHYLRGREIGRALGSRGHRVIWLCGGRRVEEPAPPGVEMVDLPGLVMAHNYSLPTASEPGRSLDEVRRERIKRIKQVFAGQTVDMFLVDLFPFGRRQMKFELLPTLERIHKGSWGNIKVACSLRDVIEPNFNFKKDARRALGLLHYYFDHLLLHADPAVQPMKNTFRYADDIEIPIHYTGYVTSHPSPDARDRLRGQMGLSPEDKLIITSLGAGAAGEELLGAVMQAHALLPGQPPVHLLMSTGPRLAEPLAGQLTRRAAAQSRVRLTPFMNDFADHLAAADLSISLAGTSVLTALAAGVSILALPFQNEEQPQRAQYLADLGVIGQLTEEDLEPQRLAQRMTAALQEPPRQGGSVVNVNGAENTADKIEEIL
jgi:predicted glycosyltransferase